jgi:hypothetical protein
VAPFGQERRPLVVPDNSDGQATADVNIPKIAATDAMAARAWRDDDSVQVRYPLPGNDEQDRSLWAVAARNHRRGVRAG